MSIGHPMESQCDAVCCWEALFLFFNVWRFQSLEPTSPASWYPSEILGSRHTPSPRYGGYWCRISRVDLRTGEHQTVLDEKTIRLPPTFSDGWVSRIMSVSADGKTAICQLGPQTG